MDRINETFNERAFREINKQARKCKSKKTMRKPTEEQEEEKKLRTRNVSFNTITRDKFISFHISGGTSIGLNTTEKERKRLN